MMNITPGYAQNALKHAEGKFDDQVLVTAERQEAWVAVLEANGA